MTSASLTSQTILYRVAVFCIKIQVFKALPVPVLGSFNRKKKPKGRDLTDQEKAKNREISSIRIRVEHAIGGIKRYRIVKEKLRNSKKGFADFVMETCCGLHNFRLNFRPWSYPIPHD